MVELFGKHMQYYGRKSHHIPGWKHHLTSEMRYSVGSITFWTFFRPGQLDIMERKENIQVYQGVLEDNVRLAVHQLKLRRNWVMQQDSDLKHCSTWTTEWLQIKKIHLLEKSSQSPDLILTEFLWNDLTRNPPHETSEEYGWAKAVQSKSWRLCKSDSQLQKVPVITGVCSVKMLTGFNAVANQCISRWSHLQV